jgi:hypothetical protein
MTHPSIQNLYIVDSEYGDAGSKLEGYRDFLGELIEDYLRITEYLCAHNQGRYIEKLKNYRNRFVELPGKIAEAGASWKQDCERFVEEIDIADEFLYEK